MYLIIQTAVIETALLVFNVMRISVKVLMKSKYIADLYLKIKIKQFSFHKSIHNIFCTTNEYCVRIVCEAYDKFLRGEAMDKHCYFLANSVKVWKSWDLRNF